MAEPPRLLRVLSAAAEERERAVASRVVSETEALSQMKTGAEIALVRDEIEALKSLQCGAAAGGRGGQKLERTSSVQGLLAQCRAHLRAGREPECIALAEALCHRDGPPWPQAHAVHGRALFRRRRWKAAAAQLALAIAADDGQLADPKRAELVALLAAAQRSVAAVARIKKRFVAHSSITAQSLRDWYPATLLQRIGAPGGRPVVAVGIVPALARAAAPADANETDEKVPYARRHGHTPMKQGASGENQAVARARGDGL